MTTNLNLNRRKIVAALVAGGAGLSSGIAFAADAGRLTDAEYNKLAAAPKTADDHRKLAKHYRSVAAMHQAEAKAFQAFADSYVKGLPATPSGQARELSRAVHHAAEHSEDFAEAIIEIAEVHEGIAAGPVK
jgi:hypothetical protein